MNGGQTIRLDRIYQQNVCTRERPGANIVRKQPSIVQEDIPHQEPTVTALSSGTSGFQTVI